MRTKGYDPYLTTGQDKALVLDMILQGQNIMRVPGAVMLHRIDTLGARQTEYKKRLQGKIRFILKYKSKMNLKELFFNIVYLFKITYENFVSLIKSN